MVLQAAPADGMHWMIDSEMAKYSVYTHLRSPPPGGPLLTLLGIWHTLRDVQGAPWGNMDDPDGSAPSFKTGSVAASTGLSAGWQVDVLLADAGPQHGRRLARW